MRVAFVQVFEFQFPSGIDRPIATMRLPAATLAQALGVKLETWAVDGLGPAVGFCLQRPEGRLFLFQELEYAVTYMGEQGPTVHVDRLDAAPEVLPRVLNELLMIAGLQRSDLNWIAADPEP